MASLAVTLSDALKNTSPLGQYLRRFLAYGRALRELRDVDPEIITSNAAAARIEKIFELIQVALKLEPNERERFVDDNPELKAFLAQTNSALRKRLDKETRVELVEGPGAEQEEQPLELKWELPPDQISAEKVINDLRWLGAGEETLQRAEAEIFYRDKPLWNVPREKQLPELRGLTAMEHLRAVWAEEIKRWGNRVYIHTIRMRDPVLIDTTSSYVSNRKRRDQDSGAATGLTFVKGFAPVETKPTRSKRTQSRQTGRSGLIK
jgi:hypothetical protein